MRILLAAIFVSLMAFNAQAQLPSGSIAPDFTVIDINGTSHHLYDYLNQGYSVVIHFDAAWNAPGWLYHQTGALQTLHEQNGVANGGNVIVLFIEVEATNSLLQIQGFSSGGGIATFSQGDWTNGISYPIADDASVGDLYELGYYPTIYTICPNGILTESGQISADEHLEIIENTNCQAYDVDAYLWNYSGDYADCGEISIAFNLTNLGVLPLSSGQFTVTGVEPAIIAPWTGFLGPLESTSIDLGVANFVGPVNITFTNLGEQNTGNNSLSLDPLLPQFVTGNLLQVRLDSDCWPEEISWNITDGAGDIIYSSAPYGDGSFSTQEPLVDIVNLELPGAGCYYFTIIDEFGDGLYGTQWGCPINGMVSLNAITAGLVVTDNLFSFGGTQAFSEMIIPFSVTQTIGIDYNVSLNVDMSNQVVSPNGVYLAGNFQGWMAGDPNYEMVDLDGDDIYSIEFNLPVGQYEYKFVNGSTWLDIIEDIPSECNVNGNRSLIVEGGIITETYCFGLCTEQCGDIIDLPTGNCQEIFISEYVEGSNNNKAIEVYNPSDVAVDLGLMGYQIGRFVNGATSPTVMDVTGIIAAHDVRVFVLDKRDPLGTGLETPVSLELQALADTFVNPIFVSSNSPFYFNGDDAVFIAKNNGTVIVDLFGKIGDDPILGWFDPSDVNQTSLTHDRTLVRKSNIGQGVTSNPAVFNPLEEWVIYDNNDFTHLGWHESWCNANGEGCTNEQACNYNADAITDDGSCYFPGSLCNDNNSLTINDVVTLNCVCSGVVFNPSQCDPSSIDWSLETAVFLPDTLSGDNLSEGFLNQYYTDNIFINTPTTLDVLDPAITESLPLNFANLTNILIEVNGVQYPLNTLGLDYTCNNGISNGNCSFSPGLPGCIEISGIPNQAGVFPLSLVFYCETSFFGSVFPFEYVVLNYEIIITENSLGCTSALACNYSPTATFDDGSCYFIGSVCDDGDIDTYGDVIDANCNCQGASFSYGVVESEDYYVCSENASAIEIGLLNLPVGIGNYALQWYCRDGIQIAPIGSSTIGWTAIDGAVSAIYTTSAISSDKTYACFVTPFAGAGLPAQWASGAVSIDINGFTAQTIIGNPNITPFTNYVYVVNPIAGNTYNWLVTNGGIISGQGTNTVTVMWGQNGPYQITLTENDGTCSDQSTLFVVNNSCALNVAAIAQNGETFCPGTSAAIQAITDAVGVSYQWYLNGVILTGQTASILSITSGGSYQVMITQGTCNAISQTLEIIQLPAVVLPQLVLSQSNPGCAGGSAIISAEGGSFSSYLWSNGSTSASIEVSTSGDYTVELSDANGCMTVAGPVTVNFALQDAVPICLVTVDAETGHNVIVWEPMESEVTSSYMVYKETNVANEYAAIGSVDYGSDGIFEDVNSNSAVQASRYKLALIDTCDIESSLSDLHKTIHLTSNLGVGNTVNLIWSHYEGFGFGSYNIYRGTSADNMTLLTTIASNLNSYTDLLPLTNGYYVIEVEGVSCDPSRTLQTSRSNIINYELVGVEETTSSLMQLYPNPASESITLLVDATLLGEDYTIHDSMGRLVVKGKVAATTHAIDVRLLSSGLYVFNMHNHGLHWVKN